MTDIAKISAVLTKAQRDALLNPEWCSSGIVQLALVDARQARLTGPLTEAFTLRWDRLTPLGLSVRQYLLEQEQSL